MCEAEIEGRAEDLKEYALGVSALGRSPDYSPSSDSCVRTRAYELRQKLRLLYELEARALPVRIELPKGSYVPQFVRTGGAPQAAPEAVAPVEVPASAPPVRASRTRHVLMAAAVLLTVLLLLIAADPLAARRSPSRPAAAEGTAELEAFWKPFLDSGSPLLVSYDTRLFLEADPEGLIVRDPRANDMNDVAASAPLNSLRERLGAGEFSEVRDYADAGAVNAIFLLTQMFTARQRPIALKRAQALGWDDLWNSNLVFVGRPNLHPGLSHALKDGDFADEPEGIRNLRPRAGEAAEYRDTGGHGSGEKYAIITQMPGPRPGHHMLVLGSAGSEFGWALAEYVTNPVHVKELVSHLRSRSGSLPETFQVLIRATFEAGVPIQIRYIAHHALPARPVER